MIRKSQRKRKKKKETFNHLLLLPAIRHVLHPERTWQVIINRRSDIVDSIYMDVMSLSFPLKKGVDLSRMKGKEGRRRNGKRRKESKKGMKKKEENLDINEVLWRVR